MTKKMVFEEYQGITSCRCIRVTYMSRRRRIWLNTLKKKKKDRLYYWRPGNFTLTSKIPEIILSEYSIAKSWPVEKAMAPHSSTLAWKIPWAEEPGGLQSMGSLRVGHDWATSLSLFTFMHWRRKWQPTPVILPGESQGRGSLVGCRLWGRTESDTTEAIQQQ